MHRAAEIKPVVIDESLVDLESLLLCRELGYTGVALKACKGHSEALLMGAAAQKYGMFLCVQDLTCPGRSFLHSAIALGPHSRRGGHRRQRPAILSGRQPGLGRPLSHHVPRHRRHPGHRRAGRPGPGVLESPRKCPQRALCRACHTNAILTPRVYSRHEFPTPTSRPPSTKDPERMNNPPRFLLATIPVVCVLLGSATTRPALAHDDHPPKKVLDEELYRATPMPDRIILTWTGDPAHSQAVNWRTDTSIAKALAQIAVAASGPEFIKKTTDVPAATSPFEGELGPAHYHSLNFTKLEPATKYVYRVGDGVNWSEWFQFTTASDKPEPFSFIYFGDAQNSVREHWSRVIREAHSDAPKARFMLHAGDLINTGNSDAEWGEWFGAGALLNAMVPSHRHARQSRVSRATARRPIPAANCRATGVRNSRCRKTVPTVWKKPPTGSTIQGTRIISLNSNESTSSKSIGSATCWPTTHASGRSSRSTTRSIRPPRVATTPRFARSGSRCSTSTRSTSCCKGTTTPTPASIRKRPKTCRWAQRPQPRRAARSTSSRSAARRCTTWSVALKWPAPPRTRSSIRSSRSTATRCATRPAPPPASCTTPFA